MQKQRKLTLERLAKRSIKGLSGKIETALNGEYEGAYSGLPVTSTACHYGKRRYWWLCPICDRRVGILYSLPWKCEWKCRHCHNAVHRSSQQGKFERAMTTSQELLNQYSPGKFLEPLSMDDKPPEMRYRTWFGMMRKQIAALKKATHLLKRTLDWNTRGGMSPDEVRAVFDRTNAKQQQKP